MVAPTGASASRSRRFGRRAFLASPPPSLERLGYDVTRAANWPTTTTPTSHPSATIDTRRRTLDDHTLRILEFGKILARLARLTAEERWLHWSLELPPAVKAHTELRRDRRRAKLLTIGSVQA